MTNEQPRTWTQAFATIATANELTPPEWLAKPMGVLRTPTVLGRFVTMKRRMVKGQEATDAGVLFSFWTETDEPSRLAASVRRPLYPDDTEAAPMLTAITGWLHDQWTASQVATTLGAVAEPQMH